MFRSLYLLLLTGFFGISQSTSAQDWQLTGPTQEAASPYNLYHYKLIQKKVDRLEKENAALKEKLQLK